MSETALSGKNRRRLIGSCLLLAVVMLLAFGGVALVAGSSFGREYVAGAAVAATVCWLAATAALVVTVMFHGTPQAVSGVLLGIGLRTGVPFGAAIILSGLERSLPLRGVFAFFVVFYLLSLATETILVAKLLNLENTLGKATSDSGQSEEENENNRRENKSQNDNEDIEKAF